MLNDEWGLEVGQIARIRIRLHWLLLAWWGYDLYKVLSVEAGARGVLLVAWALGVGLSFGSILLHELGHCFAARRVGGIANDVLLWPLGGLAYCRIPEDWRSRFFVAAAGPAVTAVIAGAGWLGFWALEQAGSELLRSPLTWLSRWYLVDWNLFILVLNLIPLYPLDGGRIFFALAWGWLTRPSANALGGYARARRWTLRISYVSIALGVIYAIGGEGTNTPFLVFFLWCLLGLEGLRRGQV